MSKTAAYIARRKPLRKRREALAQIFDLDKSAGSPLDNITSQESLTDPDCAPESDTCVSTSGTGSHAHDDEVKLRQGDHLLLSFTWFYYLS